MKIRQVDFGRQEDVRDMLEGAWNFVGRMGSNIEWMPKTRQEFEDHLLELLKNPAFEIFGVEHEGEGVAGMAVVHCPFMWNPRLHSVEEVFWWASPAAPPHAALGLLRHVIDWARAQAADKKVVISMKRLETSPPEVAKVYDRLGLTRKEFTHMGVL